MPGLLNPLRGIDLIPDIPSPMDLIPDIPSPGDLIPSIPDFELPDLDDIGDLLPDFPVPEIPIPGMPNLDDWIPDIGIPDIGPLIPELGPLPGQEFVEDALDTAGELWDREGIDAILDPVGALDRRNASQELSDRFDVVPDDFVGPRLPNQLTQAEYDQVVHTYSDIRLGRSDFEFNTDGLSDEDAEAFRQGSLDDLVSIMQTDHGRQLVGDLAYNENDHTTTLSPLFQKDSSGDYDPDLGLDNTNGFASPDCRDDTWINADGTPGDGTDSRVRYNHGETISPVGATDDWLPWRSDVLLYHELVHSHDHTHGTMVRGNDSSTGERLREQRATGIGAYENEYMSENAYRRDRQLIAAGGVGVRDGDADMPHRNSYFYHTAPATGSGSGSGSGSPGTVHDPHEGHNH